MTTLAVGKRQARVKVLLPEDVRQRRAQVPLHQSGARSAPAHRQQLVSRLPSGWFSMHEQTDTRLCDRGLLQRFGWARQMQQLGLSLMHGTGAVKFKLVASQHEECGHCLGDSRFQASSPAEALAGLGQERRPPQSWRAPAAHDSRHAAGHKDVGSQQGQPAHADAAAGDNSWRHLDKAAGSGNWAHSDRGAGSGVWECADKAATASLAADLGLSFAQPVAQGREPPGLQPRSMPRPEEWLAAEIAIRLADQVTCTVASSMHRSAASIG